MSTLPPFLACIDIFLVKDGRREKWKLGDFDSFRRVDGTVEGFTARYAAPELHRGATALAATSMDIFSTGLVFLEMACNKPFLPIDASDESAKAVLGGADLERLLTEKMTPLASMPALQGMLHSMLSVKPDGRKDATSLLQSSVFTGQVTMTGIKAAQGDLVERMEQLSEASEARLSELIKSGNEKVLAELRSFREDLQPLRSAVGQNLLELKCLGDEATAEDAAKAQQAVKAMVDGMMKESMDAQVKQQVEALAALQPKPGADSAHLIEMMSAMMEKLDDMNGQLTEVRSDVKEMKEVVQSLTLIDTKLNQLLTGSNEQVFKYFMLVPKPTKGAMASVKKWTNPKNWLTKPMLLQPLYLTADRQMFLAPGLAKMRVPGFEVAKPREFVQKHPLVVQMGMLALKVALKVGASQIGINVPTASLDALGANMDELTSSLFEMALDGVEDLVESAGSKVKEMMHNAADNAEAAMEMMKHPETALIGLMDSEEIKQAGRSQYMLFKTWLDEKYKGWQGRIGLEPKVNSEGQVEWLPP